MHTDFFLLLWQSWPAIEPERRGLGRADTQGHLASLRGRAQCWTSDQIWVNTGQSFVNDENLYEFLSGLCRQGGLTPSSQVGMWRGSRGWRINTLLHGYGGYRQQTADSVRDSISHCRGHSHISDLASPPTLGMTYSGGTDRAANNPSRYYYMRAKYGPPVMEGLERASKNTPTTQS